MAGIGKIMAYAGTVQYATPADVPIGIVIEIGMPLLLLVGFQT